MSSPPPQERQTTEDDWTAWACERLLEQRIQGHSWSYRRGAGPAVESSVMACLALNAAGRDPDGRMLREVADWLTTFQEADGSVAARPELLRPAWATSWAILAWSLADEITEGPPLTEPIRRAVSWLLNVRGTTLGGQQDVVGHDFNLVGWPWIEGTHSWVEPTVMAVWALKRVGMENHDRVAEALKLILDRALPSGGWNYGNTKVFGTELRPQPGPTGQTLALLAGIAPERLPGDTSAKIILPALTYLRTSLPKTRAACTLCWGLLGLVAWGQTDQATLSTSWLSESAEDLRRRPASADPWRLAHLIAAQFAQTTLELLGIVPTMPPSPHRELPR